MTNVSDENRQRRSRTMITDIPCQFKASLKQQNETHQWVLEILESSHSHPAADVDLVFAVHRRNTRKAEPSIVHKMQADRDAHIKAKKSWLALRKIHPTASITIKDVRNQRYHYSSLLDGSLLAI